MDAERHDALTQELWRLAAAIAERAGLELVDLSLSGTSRRRKLRLDVDRAGPTGVRIEDCQALSHAVGDEIDETDLMSVGYVLEVSSPGIDRPIRTEDDIRRNSGRRVVVTTSETVSGKRSIRGVLLGARSGALRIVSDDGGNEILIPLDRVEKAQQDVGF